MPGEPRALEAAATPAVSARATSGALGGPAFRVFAVFSVAVGFYLIFVVAVPRLPLSGYWQFALALVMLAVLCLTLTGRAKPGPSRPCMRQPVV